MDFVQRLQSLFDANLGQWTAGAVSALIAAVIGGFASLYFARRKGIDRYKAAELQFLKARVARAIGPPAAALQSSPEMINDWDWFSARKMGYFDGTPVVLNLTDRTIAYLTAVRSGTKLIAELEAERLELSALWRRAFTTIQRGG